MGFGISTHVILRCACESGFYQGSCVSRTTFLFSLPYRTPDGILFACSVSISSLILCQVRRTPWQACGGSARRYEISSVSYLEVLVDAGGVVFRRMEACSLFIFS